MSSTKDIIERFIAATNAFDVAAAVALFAPNAVIEDVSVGERFEKTAGVRRYVEDYFVGYHTVSRIEAIEAIDARRARVQLDFTGDFGHETGFLDVSVGSDWRITSIKAALD